MITLKIRKRSQVRPNNRIQESISDNSEASPPSERNSSSHEAISAVVFCAQFFGVMPLMNARSMDPKNVKFSWFSLRLFATYALLVWNFIVAALLLRFLLLIGITAKNSVGLVFYVVSLINYVNFLILAHKWPSITGKWLEKERKFLQHPYTTTKDTLKRDVKLTTTIIGFLALVEHIMYQVSTTYTFYVQVTQCRVESQDYIKLFYEDQYPYLFTALPYSHVFAVMIQVLSVTSTFVWNFMDLFIIVISVALTNRFNQLNERLRQEMSENPERPEAFFREIRFDFITLNEILKEVDKQLSSIILLSCLNNLYYICYQLMHIFQILRFPVNYAYFWMSLLYLMGRAAYLFLQASAVNAVSKEPAKILMHTPRHIWCVEIERFLYQIHTETIAMSAMGLFYFTKKIFFSMVGTIVTFELVIIQFDVTGRDHVPPPLCEAFASQ